MDLGDTTDGRNKVAKGILGQDATLHGPAPQTHILLPVAKVSAAGDPQLLLDDVNPSDHLGDRVLHLEAGVYLQKIETTVLIQQELYSAGADIARQPSQPYGHLTHFLSQISVQGAGGRFLDHLLMSPLKRTLAFTQVNDIAVSIGQDLELDVAHALNDALQVDRAVAKGRLCLAAG